MRSALSTVLAAVVLMGFAEVARADEAQDLYDSKCKVCHVLNGVAGAKSEVGGPLDGVGSKRDEAWLRAYFADPKSKIDGSKMPKMNLEDEEWDLLVKLMLSLK